MRKAIALPTGGMILSFFAGLVLILIWGINAMVTGSEVASEFFSALAVLFTQDIVGWVLLVLLLIALIKFWYIMVPFFVGVLIGLMALMYLGSLETVAIIISGSSTWTRDRGTFQALPYPKNRRSI